MRGSGCCRCVSEFPGHEGEQHKSQAAHAGSLSGAAGLLCGESPAHRSHASCPSEDTVPNALHSSVRRGVGLECQVTQVAAMYPAQCPFKGATESSETSLDGGDI